jgi:hypothetical protein
MGRKSIALPERMGPPEWSAIKDEGLGFVSPQGKAQGHLAMSPRQQLQYGRAPAKATRGKISRQPPGEPWFEVTI